MVSNVLVVNQRWSDDDILSDLFNDRDRELILSIPISVSVNQDRWRWKEEYKG